MTGVDVDVDPWAALVGQEAARDRLDAAAASPVHAYLFLGTRGSGTFRAALGFAGLVRAALLPCFAIVALMGVVRAVMRPHMRRFFVGY